LRSEEIEDDPKAPKDDPIHHAPELALSATLEIEADATLENEATGCVVSSLSCLGF
jgi:hypothetical protein